MELQLKIIGIGLIVLGLIHVIFPRYFKWKKELKMLSIINKEMMYVHTLFIAFGIFLIGILCVSSASELISTELGRKIALGLGIFFGLRLGVQFFGYSSVLWKGKIFETIVHIVFVLLWLYLTIIFLVIYFYNF